MRSVECDVVSLYVLCCSVNASVCFVCCVFDILCELFGETIRNMFGSILLLNVMDLLNVVKCILLDRPCMVLSKNVCVVPMIPVSVYMLFPYVLFVFGKEPAIAMHFAPLVCSACLPSV